jgi:hypothetical protein
LLTVRSSSEHGPDASGVDGLGAGAGLGEGVTVTVTVEGADGAGAGAGLDEELAAADGDCAAGVVCWAEQPATRATATNDSISFFMRKACGRRLGGFLGRLGWYRNLRRSVSQMMSFDTRKRQPW